MEFFNSAIEVLQTLVVALGAGLGVWGAINLLEGYGNDNPGSKSQGMKQLMAGGGVALVGITLIPLLSWSVRLRAAGGFSRLYIRNRSISAVDNSPYYNRKRIADEHPPINERRCLMQFLTHIIFLLNLLKTLINHFS